MKISKAIKSDLDGIMKMYKSCIKGMINLNIDQWDHTYPNKKIISDDIQNTTYFVAKIDDIVVGGMNLDPHQDPTYLKVNWEDKEDKFLSVHRLAVSENNWNKKVGKELMIFAENEVIRRNLKSIRLDTYYSNFKALNFYNRLGYQNVGKIFLKENKNEYYCFEKII
jgi:GNAT superfamily N-acetyltransferase